MLSSRFQAEELLDEILSFESSSLADSLNASLTGGGSGGGGGRDGGGSSSDIKIKQEPSVTEAEARDRQKKDNHNMSEYFLSIIPCTY